MDIPSVWSMTRRAGNIWMEIGASPAHVRSRLVFVCYFYSVLRGAGQGGRCPFWWRRSDIYATYQKPTLANLDQFLFVSRGFFWVSALRTAMGCGPLSAHNDGESSLCSGRSTSPFPDVVASASQAHSLAPALAMQIQIGSLTQRTHTITGAGVCVVVGGAVPHAPVVPDGQVVGAPLEADLGVVVLGDEVEKVGEQDVGFVLGDAVDALCEASVYVDGFPTGYSCTFVRVSEIRKREKEREGRRKRRRTYDWCE